MIVSRVPGVEEGSWVLCTGTTLVDKKSRAAKAFQIGFTYKVSLLRGNLCVKGVQGRNFNWKLVDPLPEGESEIYRRSDNNLMRFLKRYLSQEHYPALRKKRIDFYYEKETGALDVSKLNIVEGCKVNTLRTGRALRKVFFNFGDVGIEFLVDSIKKEFGPKEDYWTVHKSEEAEDFKDVYTGKLSTFREGAEDYSFKSLTASCMRYSFSHLPCHPSKIYASGDFEIWWTTDPEGNVGSRVIVLKHHKIHFPIYAICRSAGLKLRSALEGYTTGNDISYGVARLITADLRKVEHDFGEYVMPYFDLGGYRTLKKDLPFVWSLRGYDDNGFESGVAEAYD